MANISTSEATTSQSSSRLEGKNIKNGNARVSLVIDDLQSVDPWRPRGIKVRGTAEVVEHEGMFGKGSYLRISPQVTISWGIEPAKEGQWYSKKQH